MTTMLKQEMIKFFLPYSCLRLVHILRNQYLNISTPEPLHPPPPPFTPITLCDFASRVIQIFTFQTLVVCYI